MEFHFPEVVAAASHLLPPLSVGHCRSLKEEQGLPNSSEEVQAAVEELLFSKERLGALQAAAAAAAAQAATAEAS